MTQAEYQKKWRAEHPNYTKEYYQKNKDRIRCNMAKCYTGKKIGLSAKDIKSLKKVYEIIGNIINSFE